VNKNIGILTERRRSILKIVVQEYVKTARAVSSGTIEAKYGLGVSTATLRNELALLEEMGYLAQPHVSGGRVPTDRGYRYYVEDLMDEPAVPLEERRMIAHQFHQVQLDLTEWLRLSAAILAQSVQNASLVTAPKLAESHFKHLELISLQDLLALLVLVMHGGLVQQQMVMLEQPLTQEELSGLAARLNRRLDGQTAGHIELVYMPQEDGVEHDVLDAVIRLMHAHDQQDSPVVHYDGLANILGQPEFSEQRLTGKGPRRQQVAESMLQMLDLLQQGILFRRLLPQVTEGSGVQVFIGGEGELDDLRQYSVIVSRYGVAGGGSGMIGVLGPTRMHYGRAVSVVRFMTEMLTELAGELNG